MCAGTWPTNTSSRTTGAGGCSQPPPSGIPACTRSTPTCSASGWPTPSELRGTAHYASDDEAYRHGGGRLPARCGRLPQRRAVHTVDLSEPGPAVRSLRLDGQLDHGGLSVRWNQRQHAAAVVRRAAVAPDGDAVLRALDEQAGVRAP